MECLGRALDYLLKILKSKDFALKEKDNMCISIFATIERGSNHVLTIDHIH
jgi:hypothetical protein